MISPAQGACRAWTLVELLVAVGIIAILVILAFGPVQGMIERSKASKCAANLRQIFTATGLYTGEYNGSLPITGSPPFASPPWYNPLVPYLDMQMRVGSQIALDPSRSAVNRILQCPAYRPPPAREVSYAPSATWANLRLLQIPVPSRKIWITTSTDSYSVNPSGLQRFNFPYSGNRAQVLYFDGRVEMIARGDLQTLGTFPFNTNSQ